MEIKAGLRISKAPCGCQNRVANLGLGQALRTGIKFLLGVFCGHRGEHSGKWLRVREQSAGNSMQQSEHSICNSRFSWEAYLNPPKMCNQEVNASEESGLRSTMNLDDDERSCSPYKARSGLPMRAY